jgi:hypothetical protein
LAAYLRQKFNQPTGNERKLNPFLMDFRDGSVVCSLYSFTQLPESIEGVKKPTVTMKILFLLTVCLSSTGAFQFMKNWKMPVHDPYEEAVKDKFGDKSKCKNQRVFVAVEHYTTLG